MHVQCKILVLHCCKFLAAYNITFSSLQNGVLHVDFFQPGNAIACLLHYKLQTASSNMIFTLLDASFGISYQAQPE